MDIYMINNIYHVIATVQQNLDRPVFSQLKGQVWSFGFIVTTMTRPQNEWQDFVVQFILEHIYRGVIGDTQTCTSLAQQQKKCC